MSGDGLGAIGLVLGCLLLVLALAWLLLPFLLLSKLNEQTMRADAAATRALASALRQEQALAQVAEQTRATAEACAALTQWAEQASASLTPDAGRAQ